MTKTKGSRTIKRVLITGISGSGGSYLAEYILQNQPDVKVHGISRWHSSASTDNVAEFRKKIVMHECDLNDFGSVLTSLEKAKPDAIFHLASQANVGTSFVTPLAVLQNNIIGTANLLEAVRLSKIDPIIQLCSTSEVYGQVAPHEVPIKEDQPMRCASPYAVSKAAQDMLGLTYFASYGLRIIRTRMFAYINPRRRDLFATSFARQIAGIEAGLQKVLFHGNLDSVRTLIDVRDAMESYWVAVMKCAPGEVYNIGGNSVISVGEFLQLIKKRSTVRVVSRLDPDLLRPTDVTLQIPDVTRFTRATGWRPKYTLEESIDYLLDYWRERVRREMAGRENASSGGVACRE